MSFKAENEAPKKTKLRAIKYLNNKMENDNKFTKSKSRYREWYQSFSTARNTIDGMGTMYMIQEGQVRPVRKDILKQNSFIRNLFGFGGLVFLKLEFRDFIFEIIIFATLPKFIIGN